MPRAICVCCGQPYGQRDIEFVTVKWPIGEEMPPYRGNGIVVKTGFKYQTTNRETVRGVTALSMNPDIRKKQEADIARAPERSENVAHISVWDGESYVGGYKPFCTLRCALEYARKAYAQSQKIRVVR